MSLRSGHSVATDPQQAVLELHSAIAQAHMALVVFFCSSRFDLTTLAAQINLHFAGTPVIGCTTAGEIGPAGYRDGSLCGVSFSAEAFSSNIGQLENLGRFDASAARSVASDVRQPTDESSGNFALLLVDGLCGREELLVHMLQSALGDIPIVGASAGDDMHFSDTHVFSNGAFRRDAAVLAVIRSRLPFKVFRNHHYCGGPEPLVVTEADAGQRLVREINGLPAATEYARAAGIHGPALNSTLFATTPMIVRIRGNDYVRSISQVTADGCLKLFSAIETGVVLRVAQSMGLSSSRTDLFHDLRRQIGKPALTLGFDCIHCRLEAQAGDSQEELEKIYIDNNVVGFSSYGEQFMGIHMNHTFTGVAIGNVENNDV